MDFDAFDSVILVTVMLELLESRWNHNAGRFHGLVATENTYLAQNVAMSNYAQRTKVCEFCTFDFFVTIQLE